MPGTNGFVYDVVPWDPDGPGPAGEVLVLCGEFTQVGSLSGTNRIATYDPATATWGALGSGMTAFGSPMFAVSDLAVSANGELIAAGTFTLAGGTPVDRIARWDGSNWQPLGSGLAGTVVAGGSWVDGPWVSDLLPLPNGDLIVVGNFATAGGITVKGMARWDGTTWSSFGGVGSGEVAFCLVQLGNGDIVVGGEFTSVGGVVAQNIARWNGTTWSPMAIGGTDNYVLDMIELPNGDLVVAGRFSWIDGVQATHVARWNGSAWLSMGFGPTTSAPTMVHSVLQRSNGDLVIGGSFETSSGVTMNHLARWDGTAWLPMGSGASNSVNCLHELANGDLIAGGVFGQIGGILASGVARWDGAGWSALSPDLGFGGWVYALALSPAGEIVAGGSFGRVDGQPTMGQIARWDGNAWLGLAGGAGSVTGIVRALTSFQGSLVAGGTFTTIGAIPARNIVSWNGAVWSALGTGVNGTVFAMAGTATDLFVGGAFSSAGGVPANRIARWSGGAWTAVGSGTNGTVNALLVQANGDLVVGGAFTTAGGIGASRIARWDGASWSPLGSGVDGTVVTLLELPDGDIVAGGSFDNAGGTPAGRIARWDGTTWSALGTGLPATVRTLALLPNGDLLAGTDRVYGLPPTTELARWNGVAWSPVAVAVDNPVLAIMVAPDGGEVFVGGGFQSVGSSVARSFARLQSTCPATTTVTGAGCGGPGTNQLAALSKPWSGAAMRTRGSGLAAPSVVVAITGLAPAALPLTIVLPQSLPGCTLHATPDLVDLLVSVAGTADHSVQLPNSTALVGTVLHQQMVALEFDAMLNLTRVTATNGLQQTIGFF